MFQVDPGCGCASCLARMEAEGVDLADISINAVTAKPQESDAIRQAGFDLFWKGSAA